jgi:hypothetical protein
VISDASSDDSAYDMRNCSDEKTANEVQRLSIDKKVITSPDRLTTNHDQTSVSEFQIQLIDND